MGYNSRWDDEDERPQHHAKRKRERRSYDDFGGANNTATKKCRQCAHKHSCDQSNAQRCKRFSKNRNYDEYDE